MYIYARPALVLFCIPASIVLEFGIWGPGPKWVEESEVSCPKGLEIGFSGFKTLGCWF